MQELVYSGQKIDSIILQRPYVELPNGRIDEADSITSFTSTRLIKSLKNTSVQILTYTTVHQ